MIYVVCARSSEEARQWARTHGVPARQAMYAGSPARVDGLRGFAVVALPSFFTRRDWRAIDGVLRSSQLKMAAGHAVAGA